MNRVPPQCATQNCSHKFHYFLSSSCLTSQHCPLELTTLSFSKSRIILSFHTLFPSDFSSASLAIPHWVVEAVLPLRTHWTSSFSGVSPPQDYFPSYSTCTAQTVCFLLFHFNRSKNVISFCLIYKQECVLMSIVPTVIVNKETKKSANHGIILEKYLTDT